MNHKRKTNKRTLPRKMFSPMKSVGEWSRMLHKWWMKDVVAKNKFKHDNKEINQ